MTYYTRYSKIAAATYIRADAFSEYSADGMTYYIRDRKMAAPQYVSVDVSSDEPAD
jgi:hypothetical protein